MIAVETVSREQVNALLASELDCLRVGDAVQRATIADHIRAMAFGSWMGGGREGAPVHTTRILSNVRRVHRMVWPAESWEHEKLGDLCRQVLDALATLGDVISVGNGFWIPGPAKVVELDGIHHLMVIGGTPAQIARTHFGSPLKSAATFRFMERRPVLSISSHRDLLQSIDGWLGHVDPLREWTEAVLQQHNARLSIDMDIGVEQLDIYAPDIFRDQRKAGRWMRAAQIGRPLEGLRLCRLQSGARAFRAPHFLATFHFKGGTLTLGRSAPVAPDVSRRLRFGLDALLGAPRQVSITTDGTQFSFDNSISLPEPEARAMSLAWRTLQSANDASEFHYFHPIALPLISRALARLLIVPTFIDRRPHA
ncbi:hypothetical protein IVB30_31020 [Bradyrhizobium sp. 200]|uniref:hypothetical protein n=1 Tax=Bradyrhizobium sp. 200 TaxID=2782665 RepID=UPI001FFFF9CF|nr:hypothetical protein [Bradyrhizobium sp. 200]UPJ47665.1 hypothetical protein IVB30_31020 [Bradyrhizobium sp. 200]